MLRPLHASQSKTQPQVIYTDELATIGSQLTNKRTVHVHYVIYVPSFMLMDSACLASIHLCMHNDTYFCPTYFDLFKNEHIYDSTPRTRS